MKENSADINTGERRRSSRIKQASSTPVSTPAATPQTLARDATPIQSIQTSIEKNQSEDESSECGDDVQKRKRNDEDDPLDPLDPLDKAWTPLTDEDRKNWKGWVEVESEPVLFDFLLREYGVQCVKVQEIISLDDESMAMLPAPIYGMVFLFKYRGGDAQEDPDAEECPDNVWFANQTTENACATVALMNIVMNIPELDLGPKLEAFKQSTQSLEPPHRGQKLGDNAFIRGIHNSFLRRSDILAADLSLKNDYQRWERQPKTKRKVTKSGRKKRIVVEDSDAYHFVAYVPVAGEVWKLDGLLREPTCVGDAGDDWVSVARDNIMSRIAQYGEDANIEYNLIALTKCPLGLAHEDISKNVLSLSQVQSALDELIPDWRAFIASEKATKPIEELRRLSGLSEEDVANAKLSAAEQKKITAAMADPGELLGLQKSLVEDYHRLNGLYMEELSRASEDREMALDRTRDDTPLVYKAIKALADGGRLRDLVEVIQVK